VAGLRKQAAAAALGRWWARFSFRVHTSPFPPAVHNADAVTRSGAVGAKRAGVSGSSTGHFAEGGPGYRVGRGGPNSHARFGDGAGRSEARSVAADCARAA
jgi:hypothetical protein